MTVENLTSNSVEDSEHQLQHYVTYEDRQWVIEDIQSGAVSGPYLVPPKRFPTPLKPSKMPSYLVRVKDMQRVLGSEVNQGYCALSYSWSCSGDLVYNHKKKRFDRDDKGRHTIILHNEEERITKTRFVKFEDVIQQLCNDFGIEYIWYDQICIDQDNEVEKTEEIKRMHLIYANAHCVIALIPELKVVDSADSLADTICTARTDVALTTDWSKRAWTLEETFMAKQLLFVGQNAHLWSTVAAKNKEVYEMGSRFLHSISIRPPRYNASTMLFHAHKRTSRKLHDTVFALANLFPAIMQGIQVSYTQDVAELKIQFYSLLAEKDLSLLCYGYPESDEEVSAMVKREKFDLPSWTGINGMHIPFMAEIDCLPETDFSDYVVDKEEKILRVRSATITIPVEEVTCKEERALDGQMGQHDLINTWEPSQRTRVSGKEVTMVYSSGSYGSISKLSGLRVTHCLPIEESKLEWFDVSRFESRTKKVSRSTAAYGFSELYLSLTEKDCTECKILSSISFDIGSPRFKAYPVVRSDQDNHKSIGICFAYNLKGLVGPQVEEEVISIG